LDLHSVAELARESARLFPERREKSQSQAADIVLDLSGVTAPSSAALALMLDWLARARSVGSQMQINHWPESMVRIARFSNLGELLGLAEAVPEKAKAGH
jgi:anti-anti-sigma factor